MLPVPRFWSIATVPALLRLPPSQWAPVRRAPASTVTDERSVPATFRVPACTRVLPVYSSAVLPVPSTRVPLPCLTRPPLPVIGLLQVDSPLKFTVTSPQSNRAGPPRALATLSRPWPNTASTPGSPRSVAVPSRVCRTRSLLK